jgi:hypothetical protein
MKLTDTYKLGHIRHVIPLNENVKCSELTFTATSTDGCNFEAVVIKKSDLNSDASFEFNSSVNGMLSGTLSIDEPLEDDEYTLLLRSEIPCECIVEIQIDNENIIKKKPRMNSTTTTSKPTVEVDDIENYDKSSSSSQLNTVIGKIDISKIMIAFGVLILFYILYRFYRRSSMGTGKNIPKASNDVALLKEENLAGNPEELYKRLKEIQRNVYNSSVNTTPE